MLLPQVFISSIDGIAGNPTIMSAEMHQFMQSARVQKAGVLSKRPFSSTASKWQKRYAPGGVFLKNGHLSVCLSVIISV
jgi:hypothetical protein